MYRGTIIPSITGSGVHLAGFYYQQVTPKALGPWEALAMPSDSRHSSDGHTWLIFGGKVDGSIKKKRKAR